MAEAAEVARSSLVRFQGEAHAALDARFRKAANALLALVGEAMALAEAGNDMARIAALLRLRIPRTLADAADRTAWVGTGHGLGDVEPKPKPSDAARQVAAVAALVRAVERGA